MTSIIFIIIICINTCIITFNCLIFFVIIGAVMGSMILLTILFCLIKSFKTENSQRGSKFIEELQSPQQQ